MALLNEQDKSLDFRKKCAVAFFALVWGIILLRLFVTSIINYDYYDKFAKRNVKKTEFLIPVRGQILDRNGEPLAINELGFSIFIPPKLKRAELDSIIEHIVFYLAEPDANIESKTTSKTAGADSTTEPAIKSFADFSPESNADSNIDSKPTPAQILEREIRQNYAQQNSSYNHSDIKVLDFIPYRKMHRIYTKLAFDSRVKIAANTKRLYPNGATASHIIGYVAKANESDIEQNPMSRHTKVIGKTGIERQYNAYLQGQVGKRESFVDSLNREVALLKEDAVIARNDLVLSLDLRLQEAIDSEFSNKSGSAIVMDVHTGEILAAGSYPEYNINRFVQGISFEAWDELLKNPENPLLNKFTNGMYPPGSVVKMGMGLAFLEYAGVNEKSVIETPYFVEFAGRKFRDWKYGGHGSSDLFKAIRESVDVYFYILSQRARIENINAVLGVMGFGQKSGVDIPNEFVGVLPNPEWKLKRFGENWYVGDTIISSIGQGFFLATPLQVTRYTALLATGKLPTPHFGMRDNRGEIVYESKDVLNDFQKSKLPVLRNGMYQACNIPGGTGYRHVRHSRVVLACKTGTAQVVSIPQEIKKRAREQDMEYYSRSHAWFIAFAPYRNPKYAISVMIEHGGSGGSAGPIVANIANKLVSLGYIKN